jgi:hypothetical protein
VFVATAAAAFAAWQGRQTYDSVAAHSSVAATIALILTLATAAGRGRQHRRSRDWLLASMTAARAGPGTWGAYEAGVLVWVILVGACVVWDLVSFLAQSHQLPTLSYFVGKVTHHEVGRALAFWGWLILGVALAIGRIAAAPRAGKGR